MATRLAPGEKSGRKRMATLGTVYDAEPAVRGIDGIDGIDGIPADPADLTDPVKERHPGPKARSKWLCGSVNDTAEHVITAVFDQADARDPEHRRAWVVLVDGARHQLDLIRAEAARRNVTVPIVVIHDPTDPQHADALGRHHPSQPVQRW